jgi:hypothetical protein
MYDNATPNAERTSKLHTLFILMTNMTHHHSDEHGSAVTPRWTGEPRSVMCSGGVGRTLGVEDAAASMSAAVAAAGTWAGAAIGAKASGRFLGVLIMPFIAAGVCESSQEGVGRGWCGYESWSAATWF